MLIDKAPSQPCSPSAPEGVVSLRGGRASREFYEEGIWLSLVSCRFWFGDDWLAVFFRCSLAFFSHLFALFFKYILAPKVSVPSVSCRRSVRGPDGPFPESLVIQLHLWLLVPSLMRTNRGTNTRSNTHTLLVHFFRLPPTNRRLCSQSPDQSHIHSFIRLTVLQVATNFNSKTNKCVTCQQSIIGPFDLCRLLYPFCPLLCFPFLFPPRWKVKPHSLVQSVSTTPVLSVFGPGVIPYLTLSKLVNYRRCEGLVVFEVVE